MEKEEETREILLPNWQGSGSHGITIDQTDDGVFVKRVQQNSPAAKMGVVKEGDQIVSATVYFDNLQSGEVTQLLNSMGHHTVGLRLQRKGDKSPLPGQSWSHDVFAASSPEVVLSGDDEEYRRIYTTKIKPRLKAEEAVETECGGTQSRTITVTRKVTAYTVDVTRRDGAKDVDVVGPDFKIRIPSQEITHVMKTDGEIEPGKTVIQTAPGDLPGRSTQAIDCSVDVRGAPPGPTVASSFARQLDVHLGEAQLGKPGITVSGTQMTGVHLRTQMDPTLPESQVPGGETGRAVTVELPGRSVSGAAFLGPRGSSPRIEANGQMGSPDAGFRIKGPRLDGKGHGSGADVPGELLGGTLSHADASAPCLQGAIEGPGADVSLPAMENPAVDVGKIKIPVLKMPDRKSVV